VDGRVKKWMMRDVMVVGGLTYLRTASFFRKKHLKH